MAGVTPDGGGLIALEWRHRRVLVLLERARQTGARITLPAPALAQVLRHPERQVPLVRLSRQVTTDIVALGRSDAIGVGRLLAASGTADVVDAQNVDSARPRALTRPRPCCHSALLVVPVVLP